MAELWAEILDLDDIEPDDDFVEIGGHSLLALDVLTAVHARTGVAVPLGAFFDNPTPRGLVLLISERAGAR
jgi:phthiocerol/phenolphthiocerol synthesis type-I polyketide synthase E